MPRSDSKKGTFFRAVFARLCGQGLELVLHFGTPARRPGGVVEYRLGRREAHAEIIRLRREIQGLSNAVGSAVLVGNEGQVITTYRVREW